MGTTRNRRRAGSVLRPLAAALALAAVPLRAATTLRPGDLQGQGNAVREDGTPLRTALRAWHLDALRNADAQAAPAGTVRAVTNCDDDGAGSLRAVVAASASGDTIDLSALD